MTDIIIIGAGTAGLTAAIYAQRAGLSCLVLDKGSYGGQVAITNEIENYPAFVKITGPELAQNIYKQAISQGAEIRFEEVVRVELKGNMKKVNTSLSEYQAPAVILANGAKRRRLGVPGEEELAGAGVSYCATCDGMFFKGKTVAVCGGGNTALEDALFLSNLCEKVFLIHRRDKFTAEAPLINAVKSTKNIHVLFSKKVTAIEGDKKVSSVILSDVSGETKEKCPVAGVFIAIGYEPDNHLFAGQVSLDDHGYIIASEDCRTNLPGVFAAGDSRTKELRQIITAAADGAIAAWHAANEINIARQ